jgi:hypothetical protein
MPNERDSRGRRFNLHVAGVSHRNKDGTKRQDILRDCREGEVVQLLPEPENPHDPNAIRVCRRNGEQIGYIDQANASRLAEDLAAGWTYRVTVGEILHKPGTRSYGMMLQLEVLTMSAVTESRLVTETRRDEPVRPSSMAGCLGLILFILGLVLVSGSFIVDTDARPWLAGIGICMVVAGALVAFLWPRSTP